MAPEIVLKSPGHGKPADWWSLGIFMFDLLTGRSPFHSNRGKKETKERILRGKFVIPGFITPQAQDLLRRLLRRNVERRLGSVGGADDIKRHVFFDDVDWDLVEAKAYTPPYIPQLNPHDETDASQFDTRFTTRSPRESTCAARTADILADKIFDDFDYVSEEFLAGGLSNSWSSSSLCHSSASSSSGFEEESGLSSTIRSLQDLHLRNSGE
jgi:p70 ribosomal S6 kinase